MAKTKNKSDKTNKLTPEQVELMRTSLLMFKRPDLLTQIKTEFDKDHYGDDHEKLFVFCSECSSRLIPNYRFSTALAGYSSEGKTNVWKTTSKHLPRTWYLDLTRATKAVLEDDLKDINLVYFGEGGANEAIIETVKQMVEDGISVLKKDTRSDFKQARHEVVPRKVGIYSGTEDSTDVELSTRYCKATITGSPTKYQRVNETTLAVAGNISLEYERMKRDNGQTWINAGLSQLQPVDIITIPYTELIEVDNQQARSMRDLKRFLNLIRVLAWLHQYNRIQFTYKDKKCLVAGAEDYYNAREIGDDIFAQTLSGIEPRLKNAIDSYYKLIAETDNVHKFERDGKIDTRYDDSLKWIDRSIIQKDLGINSRDTIKSHFKALESMGLFSSVYLANRCFVASKYDSPTKLPTNHPLITHEQKAFYRVISEHEERLLKEKLVGSSWVPSGVASICRSDLLDLTLSENDYPPTNATKKGMRAPQSKLIQTLRHKISGSKLVGSQKPSEKKAKIKGIPTPTELKKYCKENSDDDKTIRYEELTKAFPEQFIGDAINRGFLKLQEDGNYQFTDVIT